ncbi:MAG: hypothetical protein RMJ31_06405 [Nitrososphaerota archaeon]|nr:hypothetical protein [Nitrososphaerales archaeon]MDW8045385.1 hypothetical protein [Nitrososphaerota archaeon]
MRESTLWIVELIALIVMIITLPIHLVNFSSLITGPGYAVAMSYEEVVARAKNLTYAISSILLLGVIIYHSMYRVRNIICELPLSKRFERLVSLSCILIGLVAFLYSTYMTIVAFLV